MLGKLTLCALALTGVAEAQERAGAPAPSTTSVDNSTLSDRLAYDAAFFTQFSPQTALDMVRQTPGFSLNSGDSRRGFSGAVGNVLIDGQRPSAKTQELETILARIPANQVLRIEVRRGAEIAGDASGQAVLLNIVRTEAAGSGVYEVGFEYNYDRIGPLVDLSYSGRNGQLEWGVAARLVTQRRAQHGVRDFYDGAGAFDGDALLHSSRWLWDPFYNANIAFPLLGGRFSATGELNLDWDFHGREILSFRDQTGAATGARHSNNFSDGTDYELGLNYDRDIGPWTLALIGLIYRDHRTTHDVAMTTNAAGATELLVTQHLDREPSETILRASLARALTPQHNIEFGGEGAFNALDNVLVLTRDDGSGPVVVPIPNSNVLVEEERAELFGAHTWRPNETWSVETRLARETSTLTFAGDANQTTELSFWKPSMQLTRTFADNNQLRFRLYRDVGQLDFLDFVSAASITDDIIDGGNPDLVPQTDWRIELGGDFRFPGGAALSFSLTHHNITDVADVVLIVAENPNEDPLDPDDDFIRFDAPGNIGDAEALSLDLNFTAPLTRFIPGGRLTVEAEFWDMDVHDPVTDAPRIFSGQPESEVEISFRQDFPAQQWSWGVDFEKVGEAQTYRFDEIDTREEGPWIDLWIETTALPNNMKLRAMATNIGDGDIRRDRRFFDTDRNGPLIEEQITRQRYDRAPGLIVELSGSF